MRIVFPVSVFQHAYGTMIKDAEGATLCVMGSQLSDADAQTFAQQIVDCFNQKQAKASKKETAHA